MFIQLNSEPRISGNLHVEVVFPLIVDLVVDPALVGAYPASNGSSTSNEGLTIKGEQAGAEDVAKGLLSWIRPRTLLTSQMVKAGLHMLSLFVASHQHH